jgi:tetratricopeptide (TPR) repeat protein
LAGSIFRFWDIRGHLTEGRGWLDKLLALAPQQTTLRAKALRASSHVASYQGQNAEGLRLLEESLTIYEELDDQIGIAMALERLGITISLLGDEKSGLSYLDRSVSILRRVGYKVGLGWALASVGMQARTFGHYDRAQAALSESYRLVREAGDLYGIAYALNNLGQLARIRADYDTAWEVLQQCLDLSYKMNNKPFICWTLGCLATVARIRGDYERSRSLLEAGLEVARELGIHRRIASQLAWFAMLATHSGLMAGAVRLFSAALHLHPDIRNSLDADEVTEWDSAFEAACATLSEEEFSQAWAEGEAMSWDEASDYALESTASSTVPK